MDARALAKKAVAKYATRDPYRIAGELGILVILCPLCEVRGARQYIHRRTIIYINSSLDEAQQRLVCAHELGHHFCHRGLNRFFMDHNTGMVSNRYENEAHRFALELLDTDAELQPFLTRPVRDAAAYMGVPEQQAAQRMKNVEPTFWALME